ncbi:MAG: thioredoxin family protein [Cyclobacteriaceae bacterium]|nr:thioredoxin family protein [Cyclobacteriaceae bacterium]
MGLNVVTDSDFSDVISSNDKVVIKYYAGWCGSCRMLSPKFKRLSNDSRFDGVAFIDIDAENNPEARVFSGVNKLPFIVTIKNGKIQEAVGTSNEENIVNMITNLMNT